MSLTQLGAHATINANQDGTFDITTHVEPTEFSDTGVLVQLDINPISLYSDVVPDDEIVPDEEIIPDEEVIYEDKIYTDVNPLDYDFKGARITSKELFTYTHVYSCQRDADW